MVGQDVSVLQCHVQHIWVYRVFVLNSRGNLVVNYVGMMPIVQLLVHVGINCVVMLWLGNQHVMYLWMILVYSINWDVWRNISHVQCRVVLNLSVIYSMGMICDVREWINVFRGNVMISRIQWGTSNVWLIWLHADTRITYVWIHNHVQCMILMVLQILRNMHSVYH